MYRYQICIFRHIGLHHVTMVFGKHGPGPKNEILQMLKNLISPISDLGFRGRCGVGCRRTPLHVRNYAVGTRSLSSKSSAACKTRSPHQQCSSWFGHSNCVFRVLNQRRCMLKPTPRRPYAGPLLGTHSVSGVPLGVLTLRTHFTASTGSGTTSNPHCLERAETLREAKCVAATSQGTSNFISENGCPFIARLQPSGLEAVHTTVHRADTVCQTERHASFNSTDPFIFLPNLSC